MDAMLFFYILYFLRYQPDPESLKRQRIFFLVLVDPVGHSL